MCECVNRDNDYAIRVDFDCYNYGYLKKNSSIVMLGSREPSVVQIADGIVTGEKF